MLRACQDFQILGSIVRTFSVFVMHDFVPPKTSPENALHNKTVLIKRGLLSCPIRNIAINEAFWTHFRE
jgi:hypothetical protein